MVVKRPWANTGPDTGAAVHITREFSAPREEVFRAWTEPELFRQWFTPPGGSAPRAELDVRPGGRYRITMKPPPGVPWGTSYVVGTYLEVLPPERLVYTFGWEQTPLLEDLGDLEHLDSRVTVQFRDLGGSTNA
jgi:uncharacterized protein YndB with AHSA1/START domain